jgi:hypothetical protein
MYTFFYVLNDYGFKPNTVVNLAQALGFVPDAYDVYDPQTPNYGNSNFNRNNYGRNPNWGHTQDSWLDLRLFLSFNQVDDFSPCRWDPTDDSIPHYWKYSFQTGS